MGRQLPHHHGGDALLYIHPFITISLFFAGIAATVAVVLSLCGSLSRKKRPPPVSGDPEMKDVNVPALSSPTDTGKGSSPDQSPAAAEGDAGEELPLPPGKQQLTGSVSFHFRSTSVASTSSVSSQLKKLSTSMSMRAIGSGIGISHKKNHHHQHHNQHNNNHQEDGVPKSKNKEKKLKHEDSIWKKTIILGEKCKVPDENDEDAIIYDEKGNRIQAYHRKTTSSVLGLSRQNSGIDRDAIPNVEHGLNDETLRNALVGKNNDQFH